MSFLSPCGFLTPTRGISLKFRNFWINNNMWKLLTKILSWFVKGAIWCLPFLSSFISVGIASLGGFYLIFRWLYTLFEDNLDSINSLFDSAISAVDRLHDFVGYDNSSVGQALMYACGIDSLFSDFTVFVSFVLGVCSFIVVGILSSIIGLLVPLIVRKCIESLAKVASGTILGS